jgi:hypothetical protein
MTLICSVGRQAERSRWRHHRRQVQTRRGVGREKVERQGWTREREGAQAGQDQIASPAAVAAAAAVRPRVRMSEGKRRRSRRRRRGVGRRRGVKRLTRRR